MSIIPQPHINVSRRFSPVNLAADYSASEGWTFHHCGYGKQGELWIDIMRNDVKVRLAGGIAKAWILQTHEYQQELEK